MVSIWVRYGFRWHSDKSYRTSRRRVRYGLSECHLNPCRTRIDIIYIFSHKITLNLSFTTKKPPLQNHRVRYGVRSELCLALKHNRGVREIKISVLWFWPLTIMPWWLRSRNLSVKIWFVPFSQVALIPWPDYADTWLHSVVWCNKSH